jgi:hypothetical protein
MPGAGRGGAGRGGAGPGRPRPRTGSVRASARASVQAWIRTRSRASVAQATTWKASEQRTAAPRAVALPRWAPCTKTTTAGQRPVPELPIAYTSREPQTEEVLWSCLGAGASLQALGQART